MELNYYLISRDINRSPYLAYRKLDGFYILDCFGEYKIDKPIVFYEKIKLPTKNSLNNWNLYNDSLPEISDIYIPSEVVLTYDIKNNIVCESHWYGIDMCWIDAESMGPYDKELFNPTHWRKIEQEQ